MFEIIFVSSLALKTDIWPEIIISLQNFVKRFGNKYKSINVSKENALMKCKSIQLKNTCAGVSLLKLQASSLKRRCFPVNFVKFLRTSF